MNNAPKVSVILPTYNRANLLTRAVQSILSQDYTDFEIIVIDDGSTDDTWQVMTGLAEPRVRYVRYEENCGVGFVRSEGVRLAQGELIAFNDSDDVWLPGKLALQVTVFERYPQIDILFGNFWNINFLTGEKALGFDQAATAITGLQVTCLEEYLYQIVDGYPQALLQGSFMALPTVMVRKRVFDGIGNFNVGLRGAEDFELWWRLAIKGAIFAYITYPLIERYKNRDSTTSARHQFVPELLKALDLCTKTALEANRADLLPVLNNAYHRVWLSLIHFYALEGKRLEAWRAFHKSLNYGFSLQAFLYFAAALAGPRWIAVAKKIWRA